MTSNVVLPLPVFAKLTVSVEQGFKYPDKSRCFLPDEVHYQCLEANYKCCVDSLLFVEDDYTGPQVLYGSRLNAPHQGGFWYSGGGAKTCLESVRHAVAGHIKRDTGLEVALERIPDWIGKANDMRWKESSSPNCGASDYSNVFFVKLSHDEAAMAIQHVGQQSKEFSALALMPPEEILASTDPRFSDVFKDTVRALNGYLYLSGAYQKPTSWRERLGMCLDALRGRHDPLLQYWKWTGSSL